MNLRIKIPQTIDWRKNNAVTKVQNQGSCGACWAFSAVGVIESMYAIKTGKLVAFSIQEMIDCSKYDEGCDGGDIYSLLRWMKTFNVTVVKDEVYPLSLSKGTCKGNYSEGIHIKAFDCGSYIDSEDLILALVALNGPVAVAINAQSWQNYVGGTIQYHCSDDPLSINHAVQIVGYDLTAPVPYYIVKNSWGDEFGMDGYLRIAVGQNLCGLAYEVCAVQLL
nr:unnamed protein product [Callosobruchus chinensis]